MAPLYADLLPGAFQAEARAVERRGLSPRYETLLILAPPPSGSAEERCGFAGMMSLTPRIAYLAQLYLLPAWQRRGIGTAALRALEQRAPPGTCEMVLHVHRDASWALRFYERNGYTLLAADEAESRAWAGGLLADWTPPGTVLLGKTIGGGDCVP